MLLKRASIPQCFFQMLQYVSILTIHIYLVLSRQYVILYCWICLIGKLPCIVVGTQAWILVPDTGQCPAWIRLMTGSFGLSPDNVDRRWSIKFFRDVTKFILEHSRIPVVSCFSLFASYLARWKDCSLANNSSLSWATPYWIGPRQARRLGRAGGRLPDMLQAGYFYFASIQVACILFIPWRSLLFWTQGRARQSSRDRLSFVY